MDSSGQYDPNDPNYPAAADEGDVRDTAQDAMDRRMGDTNGDIDGDTSYEGLVGEPSGAHSGRTGVVGEPSGTGAGASGIAGSSRTDANYDPTQQSMAGSVAGGPDATAAGQNLQQGMNQGVGDQDMSPDMGSQGVNPQGYDTTNQGLGAQAADPDLSGQDYDSQNQTDQGYDDTSSATQP